MLFLTRFVMSKHVMLAGILKTRRLEKNLTTVDLSVRTRLDPSLISRYENGNRLPTRDHALRLAQALVIDEQLVLVAWLSEKLKKVLMEENLEVVRKKAMDVVLENTEAEELLLATGNRITESQEIALTKLKSDFQRLVHLFRARHSSYEELALISLTRDIHHLHGNSWSADEARAFLVDGKTFPEHDFTSHLRLHGTYSLLQKPGQLSDSKLLDALNKFGETNLEEVPFSISQNTLLSLAQAWQQSLALPALQDAQRWLALVLILRNAEIPMATLPVKNAPSNTEEPVLHLAEYLGEWLVIELRRAIDFLEE